MEVALVRCPRRMRWVWERPPGANRARMFGRTVLRRAVLGVVVAAVAVVVVPISGELPWESPHAVRHRGWVPTKMLTVGPAVLVVAHSGQTPVAIGQVETGGDRRGYC